MAALVASTTPRTGCGTRTAATYCRAALPADGNALSLLPFAVRVPL
jgi:hypothetical protein